MQMFLKMMGQGMAQQQKEGSGDAAILLALFSRDRNLKLKVAMFFDTGFAHLAFRRTPVNHLRRSPYVNVCYVLRPDHNS